jgi:hypothetical protein
VKRRADKPFLALAVAAVVLACSVPLLALPKEGGDQGPGVLIDSVAREKSWVVVRVKVCNATERPVFLARSEPPGPLLLPALKIEQWRNDRWIIVSDRGDLPTRSIFRLEPSTCLQQDVYLKDFERIFEKGVEPVVIRGKHRASLWYFVSRKAARDPVKNAKVALSEPFVIGPPPEGNRAPGPRN